MVVTVPALQPPRRGTSGGRAAVARNERRRVQTSMQVEWSRHGLAWGLARLDHLKGLAVMGRGRPRYLNHRAGPRKPPTALLLFAAFASRPPVNACVGDVRPGVSRLVAGAPRTSTIGPASHLNHRAATSKPGRATSTPGGPSQAADRSTPLCCLLASQPLASASPRHRPAGRDATPDPGDGRGWRDRWRRS